MALLLKLDLLRRNVRRIDAEWAGDAGAHRLAFAVDNPHRDHRLVYAIGHQHRFFGNKHRARRGIRVTYVMRQRGDERAALVNDIGIETIIAVSQRHAAPNADGDRLVGAGFGAVEV